MAEDWFERHFGFEEDGEASVRDHTYLENGMLYSRMNGRKYAVGEFTTPSLEELRSEARVRLQDTAAVEEARLRGTTGVRNVIGDIAEYHCKEENRHSLFQVASLLNCLEFPNSDVTPEMGITGYVHNRTQGTCCAIACAAGTLYRNYFVPVTDTKGNVIRNGQTAICQIEGLRDMAAELENNKHGYLRVKGGYTLATNKGLADLNKKLIEGLNEEGKDQLRGKLRIGVQRNVEVTSRDWGRQMVNDPDHLVTQVFGSACSVSYSGNHKDLWEPMARLILEASYEATLWVAVLSALRNPDREASRNVFLTALGGGDVFGNRMEWVQHAIQRAIHIVCKENSLALQINLVSDREPVEQAFESLVRVNGLEQCEIGDDEDDEVPKCSVL